MIHLGFTCCLGGVALYLLSRHTGRGLESITRVCQLKDLEQLVEVENKVYPLIIAVSGRVGSETPIKCENSDIVGVIVRKTVEQLVSRRNWMFSWVRDIKLMHPMTKEVPWYLDDGTGRVNVAVAQGEIGFPLTVGGEVFEKSEPVSLFRGALDHLKGLETLGVRRIEHVLPVGTPLTVVGEAVKHGNGDVRIQKPEQGLFFVTPIPLDQLISKLGEWSRRFKYASMALTVVGVILVSKPVIGYILKRIKDTLERRRQRTEATREIRRRQRIEIAQEIRRQLSIEDTRERQSLLLARAVDAAADRRAEPVVTRDRQHHENSATDITIRDVDEIDLCMICCDQKYDAAFVKCGHMCCCMSCSSKLTTCPICRRRIKQVLKTYRH